MEKVLTKTVIGQKVSGLSMENYLAQMLEKIEEGNLERGNLEREKMELQIAVSKQLNNRHKNIIDAYRVELKTAEARANQ